MYIYIPMILLTLCFLVIQYNAKGKLKKFVAFILTITPGTLVAAFRYDNGADYLMYSNMFKILNSGTEYLSYSTKKLEWGFKYLVVISQRICSEQWFTFGVIAFVILALTFKACKDNSDDYFLSIILFFVSGLYFDSFNGIRQYVAMGIFMCGIKYIIQKDLKRYLLYCLIGFLFHKSIIFVIPLYFVCHIKIDLKKAIAITAVSCVSASLIYKLVLFWLAYTPYAYFLTSNELKSATTSSSSILFLTVNFIIGYFYYSQKKEVDMKTQILFNIQVVSLVISLLTSSIPLVSRVLNYGVFVEILYIPCVLKLIKNTRTRVIIKWFIVLLYIIVNVYGIYSNDWYGCVPYNYYFARSIPVIH